MAVLKYNGIGDCVRKTASNGGIFAFYQGILPSFFGVMIYVGISMTVYDSCKKYFLQDTSFVYRILPGVIGSVCAGCVTFPFDVVRRRLQLLGSEPDKPKKYKSASDCIRVIWKTEGIYGFYRGISLQILRSAPSTSLQLVTYDLMKRIMKLDN